MASSAGSSADGALLEKKEAPPARSAWKREPAPADPEYCAVMGDENLWPPLRPGGVVPKKAPAAPAAPEQLINKEKTETPSEESHGDRAPPVPDTRPAVPESSSSSPPPPVHTPHNHMNGAGFCGRQNGRPHGRGGGGGYNGNHRRPVGGGNGNGRGDINVHVHINGNGYSNFNNNGPRPHGRGHQSGHWHGPGQHRPSSGPPMHSPPPPPFMGMGMGAPPMPYYYDPYYVPYGPYAYASEFASGFYFPPPQDGLQFMPYPAIPVYPHHGAASVQQFQEQQGAAPPPTAEELKNSIRAQIEYYFSATNLVGDMYLRQHMDQNGWVPLTLVANFNRVKAKTTDMDIIMASLLPSDEVEVQDGKIRKRTGWEQYLNLGGNRGLSTSTQAWQVKSKTSQPTE